MEEAIERDREEWGRGWRYIEPVFGDLRPSQVTLFHLDEWYHTLLERKGADEAYRAMKTWRALYNVMASMHLCQPQADPSMSIRRETPKPRSQIWKEGEAVRLAKGAWRAGFRGLACIIAVAWDSGFQPVDLRTLTLAQAIEAGGDWGFATNRRKTGRAALTFLSARTERLVRAYLSDVDFELDEDAPIFRTRGSKPGPSGGRSHESVPYTKYSLIDDFADVRRMVFGPNEKRRLMDMRRTATVEAKAGGASLPQLAAKFANSIDRNKRIQETYMPVDPASVRAADESRLIGRRRLAAERNAVKKLKFGPEKS